MRTHLIPRYNWTEWLICVIQAQAVIYIYICFFWKVYAIDVIIIDAVVVVIVAAAAAATSIAN